MASMTIEAIERFLARDNKSMFADVVFPDGIDKTIAVNEIIRASSPFEVLYADGDYLIEAVKQWSNKYYYTFEKWQKGFAEDFSPVDNYDRQEKWTDEMSGTDTSETQVSAYDSSNYVPQTKITDTPKHKNTHEGRVHGNIGVTTSTDVLTKWTDFYNKYNIYNLISDCFVSEFCIMVY